MNRLLAPCPPMPGSNAFESMGKLKLIYGGFYSHMVWGKLDAWMVTLQEPAAALNAQETRPRRHRFRRRRRRIVTFTSSAFGSGKYISSRHRCSPLPMSTAGITRVASNNSRPGVKLEVGARSRTRSRQGCKWAISSNGSRRVSAFISLPFSIDGPFPRPAG